MSNKKCPNCFYELDSWNDCVSFNNILECPECEEHFELKAVRLNKPQLTIPQSIADEFDQIYEDTEEYQTNVAQMFSSMQHYFDLESYPEILHWLEDDVKNTNVVLAYLAGKALGVDLVTVVEG